MTNETREEEVWKIFPDYPFIEVSNLGRVRTKDRYVPSKGGSKRLVKGRILKQRINDVLKGRNKTAGGYLFTENKNDITKEKIQEIRANMPFSGGVIAIYPNTFEVFRFESQRQAARQLGIDCSHISAVTRGQRKTTGGYYFCYADKNAVEKVREKFGDALASEVEKLMV